MCIIKQKQSTSNNIWNKCRLQKANENRYKNKFLGKIAVSNTTRNMICYNENTISYSRSKKALLRCVDVTNHGVNKKKLRNYRDHELENDGLLIKKKFF